MPTPVVIICTIASASLLLFNYIQRYVGLRRRTYEVNPLAPMSWVISTAAMTIFLLSSGNLVMASLSGLSLILQAIFLIWSMHNLRHSQKREWKIRPEDFICAGLAVVATIAFYLTDNANLGALIVFVGAIFGDIPQLRKAYVAPHTDSVRFYFVPMIRYMLLTGTLTTMNFVGLANSLYWAVVCFAEVCWLAYCQNRRNIRMRNFARGAMPELAPETVEISREQ